MLPVFITETASRELEKIASEMDSLRAFIRFQAEARLACERLGLMPTIGSLLTDLEDSLHKASGVIQSRSSAITLFFIASPRKKFRCFILLMAVAIIWSYSPANNAVW